MRVVRGKAPLVGHLEDQLPTLMSERKLRVSRVLRSDTVRRQVGRFQASAAIVGCVFVLVALALIWSARASVTRDVYVSELGADGMTTRHVFMSALVCLVIGGVMIAWVGQGVRADVPVLRWWSPSISLWIASALFLAASQVTCTYGCPAPVGAAFTWQDLVHTIVAVLAFSFTCLAMLQAAFSRQHHVLATLSGICAWSVAAFAGLGGILGIVRVNVGLGSALEFLAMTIAGGWVIVFGAAIAAERRASQASRVLRADS